MNDAIATRVPSLAGAPASARSLAAARTRTAILSAATELFIERGFGAVSVRDIAAQAGLSHPGVLRHFASKDEILSTVVDELSEQSVRLLGERAITLDVVGELARLNAEIPGYIALFTTLAGEASSVAHPAHDRFRERHATLRTMSAELFHDAVDVGAIPRDSDLVSESVRLTAAWDGLQLISLYLPERCDVPAMLETHTRRLRGLDAPQHLPGQGAVDGIDFEKPWALDLGYAPGRERRARIVEEASKLFASRGFHATSLREIAECVGIGKSTLLHHFSTKDDLLAAVIAHRDAALEYRAMPTRQGLSPLATLLALPDAARHDTGRMPGLIELYAVLSAEAAAPAHPAHDYFEKRFQSVIGTFAELFARAAASGHLRADLDPEYEAVWLTALWDGLQLQWLYDPESVSVADELERHLKQLLG